MSVRGDAPLLVSIRCFSLGININRVRMVVAAPMILQVSKSLVYHRHLLNRHPATHQSNTEKRILSIVLINIVNIIVTFELSTPFTWGVRDQSSN